MRTILFAAVLLPGIALASLERLPQSEIMKVVLANKPAIVKCVNEQKRVQGDPIDFPFTF